MVDRIQYRMVCSPVSVMTVERATLSVSVQWFPLVVTEAGRDEVCTDGILAHEGDGLSPSVATAHTALPRLSHPPDKPESQRQVRGSLGQTTDRCLM